MKLTLHGVVTAICLVGVVALIESQGTLIKEQNQFMYDSLIIEESYDKRLKSLESTINKGVCILPKTARMFQRKNQMIFTVKTCDGKTLTTRKTFGYKV